VSSFTIYSIHTVVQFLFPLVVGVSHAKVSVPGVAFSVGCVLCVFLVGAFEGGFTRVYALTGG